MKKSKNQRSDRGITLVALIITIIILVILAAVSISAVYNSKIVDYAVNGATDYAGEAVKENEIMSGTESLIDSTVKKIEDILGGKTPPSEPEGPEESLAEQFKDKVGAYVNYTPDTPENATYSTVQDGAERSGLSEQIITRNTSLKWRIMNTEGNKVTLLSETIPSGNLILRGADGYNNGVKLLNDACNALYKNTTLGTTGRNLNVDDVNSLMGVTEETKKSINSSYGREYTPIKKYYPQIFQYETWGSISGSYTGNLGVSDQTSWYSGSAQASILKGKWTRYSYTLSTYKETNTVQHALATGQPDSTGATTHTEYWLASRSVEYNTNLASFFLFYVGSGHVYAGWTLNSGNYVYSASGLNYALRPVIEIDLTKANIGETGTGESTDPYSIAAR